MVSPYFNLTSTTVCANQQRFWSGIHSAASLSLFCERFTEGYASVRLSRSRANRVFVPASSAAQPGVVRLRSGDDVLDVGLRVGLEALAGVRAIDAAQAADDVVLDRLRVAVVAGVLRRAAVLRRDGQPAPRCSLLRRRGRRRSRRRCRVAAVTACGRAESPGQNDGDGSPPEGDAH